MCARVCMQTVYRELQQADQARAAAKHACGKKAKKESKKESKKEPKKEVPIEPSMPTVWQWYAVMKPVVTTECKGCLGEKGTALAVMQDMEGDGVCP